MRTESIVIRTTKSLMEISNDIRNAASKIRADIDTSAFSPFGDVGIRSADISIALSGPNFILGGPRQWGVQVVVTDLGSFREVELIAVGDNLVNRMRLGSYGNAYFELSGSLKRRDILAKMLE